MHEHKDQYVATGLALASAFIRFHNYKTEASPLHGDVIQEFCQLFGGAAQDLKIFPFGNNFILQIVFEKNKNPMHFLAGSNLFEDDSEVPFHYQSNYDSNSAYLDIIGFNSSLKFIPPFELPAVDSNVLSELIASLKFTHKVEVLNRDLDLIQLTLSANAISSRPEQIVIDFKIQVQGETQPYNFKLNEVNISVGNFSREEFSVISDNQIISNEALDLLLMEGLYRYLDETKPEIHLDLI